MGYSDVDVTKTDAEVLAIYNRKVEAAGVMYDRLREVRLRITRALLSVQDVSVLHSERRRMLAELDDLNTEIVALSAALFAARRSNGGA